MQKLTLLFSCFIVSLGMVSGQALKRGNTNKGLTPVRFESNADKMLRYAKLESKPSGSKRNSSEIQKLESLIKKTNSTQATNITYVDLGKSVNPFTAVASGRNYLSVNPGLNTVAFIRRGGATDPGGSTGLPGNKLFYDVSPQGGLEGSWQLSKGPLHSDDDYPVSTANNFGSRYPQGIIWNPQGNTDPANAKIFATAPLLDGTNDSWGGLAKGWKNLLSAEAASKAYSTSGDMLQYIQDALEVNANGDIFMSEPEKIATATSTTFTDKIIIYKYSYNSATSRFDSSIIQIPFLETTGEFQAVVGNTAISFSPTTSTGFLVVSAFNFTYDSIPTMLPYISKTIDGGTTWSPLKLINFNYGQSSFPSPDLDTFRDSLFGNFVRFTEEEVVSAQRGDEFAHKVDYWLNDFDLVVDQNDYAHIFAQLCVTSFGDTLFNEDPTAGLTFRPGFGTWFTDITIKDMDENPKACVLASGMSVRGSFGDFPDANDNIEEDNRPQVSRSADGSRIAFVWFDTDQEAHPQLTDNINSNPDLWMRSLKVDGPGLFSLSSTARNMTKGSDNDGLITLGTIAPIMFNTPTGYEVAGAFTTLPLATTPDIWPVQHIFIKGLTLPDTFTAVSCGLMVGTNPVIEKGGMALKMNVLPNPNNGLFNIQFNLAHSSKATFSLTNGLGQTVFKREEKLPEGDVLMPFDLQKLHPGIYFLSVQIGDRIISKKIVKN